MSETPKGWKLVPIEPTEAMVEAGRIARMNIAGGYDGPSGWEAMLDVAPESPTDLSVGWEAEEKLTVEEAWTILCETPDITSPEGYPDHALITIKQLGSFMARASTTVNNPATLEKSDFQKFDVEGERQENERETTRQQSPSPIERMKKAVEVSQ
jgi:hypothetical protein